MGMVKCGKHGLTPIMTVCSHLTSAIDRDRHIHANVVVDDWVTPSLVCDECEAVIAMKRVFGAEPDAGFDHLLDAPLEALCADCVDEWFERQGMGDLHALIDRRIEETRALAARSRGS